MFFAGKTALKAAMQHAPIVAGRERYVFYALPHLAIDEEGQLGVCTRKGRKDPSPACGALHVILDELKSKELSLTMDNNDTELSLIRIRLLEELSYGQVTDLLTLTKIVLRAIQDDFRNAFKQIVDTKQSDYAFVSGIQIHAHNGNFIWPAESYMVVQNKKSVLSFT